jgi:hypothetical protein
MVARKPLRVVAEGEARPGKPMSVLEAAESGDYLAELRALRRRIAHAVSDPNCPARDLAALSRRQIEIAKEINAIESTVKGDEVGDAAATPDEEWAAT